MRRKKIKLRQAIGHAARTKILAQMSPADSGKMSNFPFSEQKIAKNVFLREFKDSVDPEELAPVRDEPRWLRIPKVISTVTDISRTKVGRNADLDTRIFDHTPNRTALGLVPSSSGHQDIDANGSSCADRSCGTQSHRSQVSSERSRQRRGLLSVLKPTTMSRLSRGL